MEHSIKVVDVADPAEEAAAARLGHTAASWRGLAVVSGAHATAWAVVDARGGAAGRRTIQARPR